MKARYKVVDIKNNNTVSYYTKWQWELAFILIFVAGIGMGILISYVYMQ